MASLVNTHHRVQCPRRDMCQGQHLSHLLGETKYPAPKVMRRKLYCSSQFVGLSVCGQLSPREGSTAVTGQRRNSCMLLECSWASCTGYGLSRDPEHLVVTFRTWWAQVWCLGCVSNHPGSYFITQQVLASHRSPLSFYWENYFKIF